MSMMIGVACSLGLDSTRVTPSMRSRISSSAGSDIGVVLLLGWTLFCSRIFRRRLGEKWCKRWNLISGAFDADHGGAVDVEHGAHGSGKLVEVTDVDRPQARD